VPYAAGPRGPRGPTGIGAGLATTKEQRRIVETPTEARQAGPSVFVRLMVSTGLAILILGMIWFAFFRA